MRDVALNLPETSEQLTWDMPTFRVRSRIFAMLTDSLSSISCKPPPGLRDVIVESDPERFFVPPYVGAKGWIGVRLGMDTDWDEVRDLIEGSYCQVAPRRLARLVEGRGLVTRDGVARVRRPPRSRTSPKEAARRAPQL